MQRRKFLIGMGSLAAGGAAAMGTGAFTSVSAQRDVTVTVADDANAFLKLTAPDNLENSEYVDTTGETIAIDISGDSSREGQSGDEGLNKNATTTFLQLFKVANQGTETVGIRIPLLGTDLHDDFGSMGFFVGDEHNANDNAGTGMEPNENNTISFTKVKNYNFDSPEDDLRVLTPGDDVIIGMFITTDGDEPASETYNVEIRAENEGSAIAGDR